MLKQYLSILVVDIMMLFIRWRLYVEIDNKISKIVHQTQKHIKITLFSIILYDLIKFHRLVIKHSLRQVHSQPER